MKLNIGSGAVPLDGYVNIDRKTGADAFPLDAADGSCDEIRASHVLEHFSHTLIDDVLKDWTAKLKPGGLLKIAVPNFEWIAQQYTAGGQVNVQGYVMGGHTDPDDRHGAIFDAGDLADRMRFAGLVDIRSWEADAADCSALPVSLNLCGNKPALIAPGSFKVSAVMSVPRLGFMDNFHCALNSLQPLGIKCWPTQGAFWGQCLERGMEAVIAAETPEAVLCIDYDTVFTPENVAALMRLMVLHPEADAICAFQSARGFAGPLVNFDLPEGMSYDAIPVTFFSGDLNRLTTAHFGLTLLRASALQSLPKPWLWSKPSASGDWGDGRTDDDIYFWRQWSAAGKTLFNANRVVVGHLELTIRWPGRDLQVIHQRAPDFFKHGKPKGVWT